MTTVKCMPREFFVEPDNKKLRINAIRKKIRERTTQHIEIIDGSIEEIRAILGEVEIIGQVETDCGPSREDGRELEIMRRELILKTRELDAHGIYNFRVNQNYWSEYDPQYGTQRFHQGRASGMAVKKVTSEKEDEMKQKDWSYKVWKRIGEAFDMGSTILTLSGYQLTNLPSEIWELDTLTKLHLNGNKLTKLPPEIGNVKNLTVLNLSNNQITELPVEIGQLKNLKLLTITNNQLKNLPPEIGNLTNLTSLELSDNLLTELPQEIENLSNLKYLELLGNDLTEMPSEISNLPNLIVRR